VLGYGVYVLGVFVGVLLIGTGDRLCVFVCIVCWLCVVGCCFLICRVWFFRWGVGGVGGGCRFAGGCS